MIALAPLADAPADAVETLLDAAFGRDRHRRTAYRLRAGVDPIAALSFAAFDDGRLVGSLQSWPIELADPRGGAVPLVLVGPVAVDPACQRGGLGRRMMNRLIAVIDAGGWPPLVLIGDPEYYERFFGFTALATGGWQVPGPVDRHRLLARIAAGVAVPRDGMLRARTIVPAG